MVEADDLNVGITSMHMKLEMMTKWLRDSGLSLNKAKTECCLFHKNDHILIDIVVNGITVRSKSSINVLGVLFDSKLNWSDQVAQSIRKAKSAVYAIKQIRKFFTRTELRQLLTSNFYSILYYNCEIWLQPGLNSNLKSQLLSASAKALQICDSKTDVGISFEQLHLVHKRANPQKMMTYRLALQLFKIHNSTTQNNDWLDYNFQQNFNNRMNKVQIIDRSSLRIGRNNMMNRMTCLNGKIDFDWLNL